MTTTFVPGAGGGGTQYPDGATQATPTGTAALGKNPSNVLKTISLDASGNLNVNLAAGSISGGNAAAAPTGAAVPANAGYTGFNSAGNLVGVSSATPLPVSLANTGANATAVKVDGSAVTQPVSGSVSVSNFPATQPISGTVTANAGTNLNTSALALDTTLTGGTQKTKLVDSGGANVGTIKAASTAAAATDPALVVAVSPNNTVAVTGTFFQATQPISATTLPLPTGAATSAKQPALGTAGAASADVISVQGVASMTALKVDGSGVTQPVSGAVNATLSAETTKVIGTARILGNGGATLDSTAAAGTAPTNALLTGNIFNTTIPAPTAGQAVAQQCDAAGSIYVNTEGRKATYRMAVRGFTPVASASSPIFSIQGSSTKTVRITRIKISWSCTTGTALPNDISLQKFSVLTGGTTGNTPTGAKNDTNNAAQTAVCLQYSVVPTTATAIGGISAVERMTWITAGAGIPLPPPIDWAFGNLNEQGLVLRGTSEFYGIILAAIGTTPVISIWIEWTEE